MDFAALEHSVFLRALGSAILNSLWQCFILWLIYETVLVCYKSASARFKNNLSTLLLFCSFAWFVSSFISKILTEQNPAWATAIPAGYVLTPQPGVYAVSGFSTFLSYASASIPYLSVAYIFLLLFLMAKLFAAYRYVYFISSKRSITPAGQLQLFASKVAREIGISKKVSVWISYHIDVPATIGFIKPVILIPFASINNLSCLQLEAIILHELSHIKRNDYITNLIISVIETTLFFNPFVVLLSNIIKRERENCCDDFVLQYRYDPHSYASALLRLEQSRMGKLKLAIGAVSGKKQLLSRIKRITNSQVAARQFNYGQKMLALLLVTAIICSVAWLSPQQKKSFQSKVLASNIKSSIPPLKIKAAGKAQQSSEVVVVNKQIDNLSVISEKHASPKNDLEVLTDPDVLPDSNIENLPEKNTSDAADDSNETKGNEDFSKTKDIAPQAIDLKRALGYLSDHNLKMPRSIKIQNFPFQNMNFNIELNKTEMRKLNENLKLAYKQINALDWNKVHNEILKSFSKMKPDKFLQKEQDAIIYGEKAKALSQLNFIQTQPKYNSKAILDLVKNELLAQDSLSTAQVALWNDNHIKIQHSYEKMQRMQRDRNISSDYSYNFNYSNDNTAVANNDDCDNDGDKPDSKENSTPSKPMKKIVQISIRRTPSHVHTGVLNESKPLQFSINKGDEKSNHENLISVEISE